MTISLPPEFAAEIDAAAAAEGRTRSELLREAARQYLRRRNQWERIFAYGEQAAVRAAVPDEDAVAAIVTAGRRMRRATE